MADSRDASSIPSWDGSARTWRRYTREVSWFVQSTPVHKRRYCASKLLSRLSGPARLLAMSWSKIGFDAPDGTKLFLQRLASSPLVRRSLPNAAAICTQYFGFRRNSGESIQNFLVRETLVHEEFIEAIIRLHEDKVGVSEETRDFGFPPVSEVDDYPWHDGRGWSWWPPGDDAYEDFEGGSAADGPPGDDSGAADRDPSSVPHPPSPEPPEGRPPQGATGSSPSHHRDTSQQGDVRPSGPVVERKDDRPSLDELSVADSFILDVLRGWRLLQAAGLSHEEKRDILSTTRNSLDYQVVSSALQGLWDDQLIGGRSGSGHNAHYLDATDDQELYYAEDSWWNEDDSWWSHAYYADGSYEDDGWWHDSGDQGDLYASTSGAPSIDPESDEKLQEAHRAEQVAEGLAADAHRTWTEAQKATAALRRDRIWRSDEQGPGSSSLLQLRGQSLCS